jgi:hypothetical protein
VTSPSWHASIRKEILKFLWKLKRPQIAKAMFSKTNNVGAIMISDFKLYYRGIITDTVW